MHNHTKNIFRKLLFGRLLFLILFVNVTTWTFLILLLCIAIVLRGKIMKKKKVWKFMAYLKACRFNTYIKTRASNCKARKIPKFISWYYSSDHHHLEEGVHSPQEEEAPLQEEGAEAEVAQDLPPTEGPDLHTKEDKQKRLATRFSSPSVLAKFTVKFMCLKSGKFYLNTGCFIFFNPYHSSWF